MKRQYVVSLFASAAIIVAIGMSQSLAIDALPIDSNAVPSSVMPSPTPFPTLSPASTPAYNQPNDDQLDTFNQQFDTPNCSPPCLWGMFPGVSRLEDIYRLFQTADFLKNLNEGGTVMFDEHPEGELNDGGVGFNFASPQDLPYWAVTVNYLLSDDVLMSSTLRAESPARWQDVDTSSLRLSAVLTQVESIPKIYVVGIQSNGLRSNFVALHFLFEQEGIFLDYMFDFSNEWDIAWQQQPAGNDIPPLLPTCPTLTNTRSLLWRFWDAEKYTYIDIDPNMTHPEHYPVIEDVFGVSAATFVQYFRAHPDGCLESAVSETYYRE